MIKILICEDSQVIATLLKIIFEREPDFEVVGHARNGRECVQMAHNLKPDLITMDIFMPVMDGFEATRIIMSTEPVPIVVISSSVDNEEIKTTFRAIEEGALSVIKKPYGISHRDFEAIRRELVETVRAMAEIKVLRRRSTSRSHAADIAKIASVQPTRTCELVAIGCSTGGPQVLQQVLSSLPKDFPVPIVIAQHISSGFIGGLVSWLGGHTLLRVKEAQQGELLLAGTVYFAPDDYHLLITRNSDGLVAQLKQDPPVDGFRPSASSLLKSAAKTCAKSTIGAIFTGMGCDGADGLLALRRAGGHTIVQDAESAVVFGMPGAAIALDAVDEMVKLDKIAAYLAHVVRKCPATHNSGHSGSSITPT